MSITASASILTKIQGLINRAEHPGTPEAERAACHAKAEELIRKYRVEQEQLLATDQITAEPVRVDTEIIEWSEYAQEYFNMIWDIAKHAGVRVVGKFTYTRTKFNGRGKPDGHGIKISLVGYEGDVQLVLFLVNAARLTFAERIEPTVDRALSDAENCWRMRSAGITRERISEQLWGIATHQSLAKVAKLYKIECERRGEAAALDGRGISAKQYRDAYAKEFTYEIDRRLRAARDAADSSGGTLVLHGRQDRVNEAFWTHFPHLRPTPKTDVSPVENAPARKPAKLRRWTKADEARWQRTQSAAAQAGRQAGKRAAGEVGLDRVGSDARLNGGKAAPSGAIEG